tara:strand:+ start:391 stop:540 length:150 start_codon:yes stop_codon:yes gene_type:complete
MVHNQIIMQVQEAVVIHQLVQHHQLQELQELKEVLAVMAQMYLQVFQHL